MDALTRLALVGTRHAGADPALPIDGVIPEAEVERRLLLRAGAMATWRRAGHVAARPIAPEAAPVEVLAPCSARVAAHVLAMVTGTHADLLDEASGRMVAHGVRLPHDGLPELLDAAPPVARPLLRPILGERARWLAHREPAWAWVLGDPDAGDAPSRFDEGAIDARVAALEEIRRANPAEGRAWVEGVWEKEKAPIRTQLLAALSTGLHPDDEPLLERARKDRSTNVRDVAVDLLVRLPTSAVAARIRSRVEAMWSWAPGSLTASPPKEIDEAWVADGLPAEAPQGTGKRAFWLSEAIGRVDPAHWEARFGVGPAEILASEADDYHMAILQGLVAAAARFERSSWAPALWDRTVGRKTRGDFDPVASIAPLLSPAEAEARALKALTAGDLDVVVHLARRFPWSEAFADAWLAQLKVAAAGRRAAWPDPWLVTVSIAGRLLPRSRFAAAVAPITVSEDGNAWLAQHWGRQLELLHETIRIRSELWEDLP